MDIQKSISQYSNTDENNPVSKSYDKYVPVLSRSKICLRLIRRGRSPTHPVFFRKLLLVNGSFQKYRMH